MSTPVVLIVDDEDEILNTLMRLFHNDSWQVLTAPSGAAALAILEQQAVWVAVVDERMPGLSGTELLRQMRARYPATVRILLTGFGDVRVAVTAINESQIFQYVAKPWDDDGLRALVRTAIEHYQLVQENQRLQQVTQAQNAELRAWNQELEQRVAARTAEIDAKNRQLQDTFVSIIEMLQAFIELRGADAKGHGRRVSRAARYVATALGLDAPSVRQIEIAAMLHDLGKLGLPERVLEQERARMSRDDFAVFSRYPILGYVTLRTIGELGEVSLLVRHHRELLNGTGFPDRLRGDSIPLGSRIILVADEFDEKHSRLNLEREIGTLYDPRVVAEFFRYLDSPDAERTGPIERGIRVRQLREGMVLTRDLYTRRGLLLATRGKIIDRSIADKVENFHQVEPINEPIFVQEWEPT
ncbi:MAG: response regulator [Chloroflexi bacterium]|nr:response regulator [Chloroflexota bacterium]